MTHRTMTAQTFVLTIIAVAVLLALAPSAQAATPPARIYTPCTGGYHYFASWGIDTSARQGGTLDPWKTYSYTVNTVKARIPRGQPARLCIGYLYRDSQGQLAVMWMDYYLNGATRFKNFGED